MPSFMDDLKRANNVDRACDCDIEAVKRITGVAAIGRWYKRQQQVGIYAPCHVLAGRRARSTATAAATGAAADIRLAESIAICFAKDAMIIEAEKARATAAAARAPARIGHDKVSLPSVSYPPFC